MVEYAEDYIVQSAGIFSGVEKNQLQNISVLYFDHFYQMDKWINDYVSADWITNLKLESSADKPIPDPDVLIDQQESGFFTSISSFTWTKLHLHRSQAMYMLNNLGNKISARKYFELDRTPE